MEKIMLWCLVICGLAAKLTLAADILEYETGTTGVDFVPKVDDKILLMYIDTKRAECASDATTVVGTSLKFTLTTTSAAPGPFEYVKISIPAAERATCGIVAGTAFKVIIQVGDDTKKILLRQLSFEITIANFDKNSGPLSASPTATSTSIAGVATLSSDVAALKVYAVKAGTTGATIFDNNDPDKKTVNAGDPIVLVVITDATKGNKIKLTDVKLDHQAVGDSGEAQNLFDANGCGGAASQIGGTLFYKATDKCEKVTPLLAVQGKNFFQCGGQIPAPKFTEHDTIYIKGTLTACATGDTTTDCDYNCPPTGRRRRRDTHLKSNQTHGAVGAVLVFQGKYDDQRLGNPHETAARECLNHITWMTVIGVLAFLLAMTLFVAIYFSSKALRNNRGEVKSEYPNPAYKA